MPEASTESQSTSENSLSRSTGPSQHVDYQQQDKGAIARYTVSMSGPARSGKPNEPSHTHLTRFNAFVTLSASALCRSSDWKAKQTTCMLACDICE